MGNNTDGPVTEINDVLAGAALEVACLELAHRRPTAAAEWLDRAADFVEERWRARWLAERAEAAAGAGEQATASGCLTDLERIASTTGDHWTCGAVARTRAVLADDAVTVVRWATLAAGHFRTALASTDAGRALVIAAEASNEQPATSRAWLLEAAALFRVAGAVAWEQRARSGLLPVPVLLDQLTAAERRVAEAVADGARNREVAERLCVSVRTVETHLDRVYRKLGIRSRTELVRRAFV